jgi:hypothetical protein
MTPTEIVRAVPHATQYLLLWCPDLEVFTDFSQAFDYTFQVCPITDQAGHDCRDFFGGRVLGAANEAGDPHVDKFGNPLTCFGGAGSPFPVEVGRPFRLRLRGQLTSEVPIDITIEVVAQ